MKLDKLNTKTFEGLTLRQAYCVENHHIFFVFCEGYYREKKSDLDKSTESLKVIL